VAGKSITGTGILTEVLAPLNNVDELKRLAEAGADAFYCGIMSRELQEKYSNIFSLNFRHNIRANFTEFTDFERVREEAANVNAPVYFTANATPLNSQFDLLEEEVGKALETLSPAAVLLGDLSVLIYLRPKFPGVRWFVGTKGGTFNSGTAKLYAENGASRFILPRQMSPSEWREIIEACRGTDIEFEVFVKNERCHFPNAFCRFEHGISEADNVGPLKIIKLLKRLRGGGMEVDMPFEMPHRSLAHRLVYDYFMRTRGHTCLGTFKIRDSIGRSPGRMRLYRRTRSFFDACGACDIHGFVRDGSLAGLKIVGRGTATERKLMDIRLIRFAVDAAAAEPDEERFRALVRCEYRKIFGKSCAPFLCYYPSAPGEGAGGSANTGTAGPAGETG